MGSSPTKGKKNKAAAAAPQAAKAQPVAPKRPAAAAGARESVALRIAWWSLLALVFAVPIAISNWTWTGLWQLPFTYDQFDIAKIFVMRALTLVSLAAWSWHVFVEGGKVRFVGRGGEKYGLFTWFEIVVIVMLAWLALTTLTSIHPPTALFGKYRRFEGLVSFINYAVLFFLTLQLCDRPSKIRKVLTVLFFSNLFVSGYAVLQFLGSVSFDRAMAVRAAFLRLAGLSPLIVGGLIGLADGLREKRFRVETWIGAGAIAWFALLTTMSLTGAIGWTVAEWFALLVAFIGGAGWLYIYLPEGRRATFVKGALLLTACGLAAAWYMNAAITGSQALAASSVSLDLIRWGELPFEANRGFSTYGNPDLLGGFLMFPLTISLALALSEVDWRWRAMYWAGSLLTFVAWITAYVRGAWIGGMIGLIVFGIGVWRSKIKLRRVDWVLVGASVAVVAIVVIVSLQNPSDVLNIGDRIASIFAFGEGSALTRTQIWQAAVSAIKDKPIVGWGLDTFRLVFPSHKPYEYVAAAGYLSVADNVHNYPLQLASGVGIVGLILVYGAFFVAAWMSVPVAFAKEGGEQRLLQAGVWSACAAYVAHLFFGLSVTGSTVFLWICIGLLLSPIAKEVLAPAPSWGVYAAAGSLALAVLLFIGNFVYASADGYYLQARIASRGTGRVDAIKQAIRLNPTNDMYRSELGLAYQDIAVSTVFEARNAEQQGADTQALYEQSVEAVKQAEAALLSAIEFVPTEYDNYVFIANLYNFAADYVEPSYRDKAVEYAKKGIGVEEYGPAIRYQLAIALAGQNKNDEAIKVLHESLRMTEEYPEEWALLGDLYTSKNQPANSLWGYSNGLLYKQEDEQMRSLADQMVSRLVASGHADLVVVQMRRLFEETPFYVWAGLTLGDTLASQGKPQEAADAYRAAIDGQKAHVYDEATLQKTRDALASLEASAAK